jgi:hypothetical protein
MATGTRRSAALIALSVGGGAAITVLGAGEASAGDAEANGNQSSSRTGQTLHVAEGSDPSITGLNGATSNVGVAAANTGVNGSEEVEVQTGHARADGNQARNRLGQSASVSGSGGGLVVVDQDAHIRSWGGALADTGFNDGAVIATGNAYSWGNRSWSDLAQDATIDGTSDALRLADQYASIGNLGGAYAETGFNVGGDVTSGNASAGGNESGTGVAQSANLTQESVGAALVEQRSRARNRGGALANTGWNEAQGDESDNLGQVFQNGELVDESTENDD